MSLSNAPLFNTTKFNDAAFQFTNYLTKTIADQYYISLTFLPTTPGIATAGTLMLTDSSNSISGLNSVSATSFTASSVINTPTLNANAYLLAGSSLLMSSLTSVTAGTASASKALIVDSNKDITGIRNFTATNLYGTLQTVAQTNITSLGTLTGLTINGNLTLNNITSSLTISGTNSSLNLTGSSTILTISNTTASTSSSTGAIQCSGGIYLGANSYCNANLTIIGTTSHSSSVSITGSTSILTIANTTDSTSSSTGAIQCSGGSYFGGKVYMNSNLSVQGSQTLIGSLLITGAIAFQSTSGINMNTNSISNCTTFTLSGVQTSTNTTTSTSFSTGALLLSGAIGIGLADDATSSTSGGTFTTRGGMAIAKSLYVGTNLTVGSTFTASSLSTTGTITSGSTLTGTITDSGVANLVNPVVASHLLSSGTPTANSFGIGMLFNGPNASGTTISYGRIYSTCQLSTAGLHQGSLTFSSVIGGSFVDVMTISSLTSSTNNLVSINGATSVLSVYNISNKIQTISNASANPSLNITGSSNSQLCQINYKSDDGTIYETGMRCSAAGITNAPSNGLYWYCGQINMSLSSAGIFLLTNSSVSTTSTSNAVQIAGGLYTAKAILNNSNYNCNTANSGATSHSVSTQALCLNDQAIYFRNQNGGDTNHGIMYSGNGNSNWNSSNGFGNNSTYKTDGPVLWGNAGVMIGNLNNSGTETICATFTGTTTNLLGTCNITTQLNINSPTTTTSKLNIQSFGSSLNFAYDASHNGYWSFLSDSRLSFTALTTSGNNVQYWFDSYDYCTVPRFSLSGNSPPASVGNNFRLHFGSTAADIIISLYNPSNITPTYGFGANNSAIQYISAGTSGHTFYNSSSVSGVGAQTSTGTLNAQIDQYGNVIAQAGFRCVGSNPHYSGSGAEIEFTSSTAHFFGYNRSTLLQTACQFGNGVFVTALGATGIGTTNTSQYPLEVGYNTQTVTGSYGYLNSSGSTGSGTSGTGASNFSAKFNGRIAVSGEVDCYSDKRLKSEIRDITEDEARAFINHVKPKHYMLDKHKETSYGYIAQDICKAEIFHAEDLQSLITMHTADEIDELIDVCDCGTQSSEHLKGCSLGFVSPKDITLAVNYVKICALLHKYILMQDERISKNEQEIEELKRHLSMSLLSESKANKSTKSFKRIGI